MSPRYTDRETTRAFAADHGAHPPQPWSADDGVSFQPPPEAPHNVAVRGLGQTIGLDPRAAFLTIAVDTMLFPAVGMSLGTLLPLAVAVGAVLAYLTYKIQRRYYLDDDEAAKIKALAVGLLTAIPTPLPYGLFIPAGIVGFIHGQRRKA